MERIVGGRFWGIDKSLWRAVAEVQPSVRGKSFSSERRCHRVEITQINEMPMIIKRTQPAGRISQPVLSIYFSSRKPNNCAWASLNINFQHRGQ